MTQPLSDYFALEAGEFLDQLDKLLSQGSAPDPDQFFRLARGVRGSAQIAGVEGVANVAARLEHAARTLRLGTLTWSDEVRQRAIRTLEDLRVLVRTHSSWGPAEDARARDAAARWGAPADAPGGAAVVGGDQLYLFVHREIAGVVGEMDRVLAEIALAPEDRELLRVILRRMRPVRGVAGLPALSPVLEVLEGIEELAQEVMSRSAVVDRSYQEILRAAREALEAAGQTLERGEAPGDSPELERFRELRDGRMGGAAPEEDASIVHVSDLFFDDAGPHVVASPLAPVAEAGDAQLPDAVESFLRIEATGFLDRAEGLVANLPSRPERRFSRVAGQLAGLAVSVRELAETYGMAELATAADDAATSLRTASVAEEARMALARLRAALPGAVPGAPAPSAAAPASSAATSAQAPVDPEEGADVIAIEALLYDGEAALREALALRTQIESLIGAGSDASTPLRSAIDDLFALVELGLQAPRAS